MAQYGVAQLRLDAKVADDVKTAAVGCVDLCRSAKARCRAQHGVVRGVDIDVAEAVDSVILPQGLATLVISRKRRTHDESHICGVGVAEGVDLVGYVVYREVEVATVVQVLGNTLSLSIEQRDIELIATLDEATVAVGKNDVAQRAVAEAISEAIDARGLALTYFIGDLGAACTACGVDVVCHVGVEIALGAHVGLEVGDRLLCELHVEQYGLLTNLTLEVIPPVILLGVGMLVDPDVEVDAKEALVGRLTNVDVDAILIYCDALVARCGLVLIELNLRNKILTRGKVARHVAADNDKRHQHT